MVQSRRNQDGVGIFVVPNQPQEISSLELMISQRRDVTRGIQPKFVYQTICISRLLWTSGTLGGGWKHQCWCVWGD
jgi:hypothetical protein